METFLERCGYWISMADVAQASWDAMLGVAGEICEDSEAMAELTVAA